MRIEREREEERCVRLRTYMYSLSFKRMYLPRILVEVVASLTKRRLVKKKKTKEMMKKKN